MSINAYMRQGVDFSAGDVPAHNPALTAGDVLARLSLPHALALRAETLQSPFASYAALNQSLCCNSRDSAPMPDSLDGTWAQTAMRDVAVNDAYWVNRTNLYSEVTSLCQFAKCGTAVQLAPPTAPVDAACYAACSGYGSQQQCTEVCRVDPRLQASVTARMAPTAPTCTGLCSQGCFGNPDCLRDCAAQCQGM